MNKRRENMNEDMTNSEIRVIIKMIIQILKDNNVDEKVIKKIEDLLI